MQWCLYQFHFATRICQHIGKPGSLLDPQGPAVNSSALPLDVMGKKSSDVCCPFIRLNSLQQPQLHDHHSDALEHLLIAVLGATYPSECPSALQNRTELYSRQQEAAVPCVCTHQTPLLWTAHTQPACCSTPSESSDSTVCDMAVGAAGTKAAARSDICSRHRQASSQLPHAPAKAAAAVLQQAREHVAAFAGPQDASSLWVVVNTVILWVGMVLLGRFMFAVLPLDTWWSWALAAAWGIVRVGTFVRSFIVMHDALHGALFKRNWMNKAAAYVTGLLTLMDAEDYGRTHGQHHNVLGVEESVPRDTDLMVLFTTKEWAALPFTCKAAARVLCDPLVYYTAFPAFFIMGMNAAWPQRVTHQSGKARILYILCRMVMVPIVLSSLFYILGSNKAHVLAELAAMQAAMSYAFFLFQVQHVYEGVYRVPQASYYRGTAALQGSSCLPVPVWWEWATLGVGYHHIHHLNVRVPVYMAKECHETAPPGLWEAAGVRELSARDGFRSLLMSLWDADRQCYVPFPEWEWLDKLLIR